MKPLPYDPVIRFYGYAEDPPQTAYFMVVWLQLFSDAFGARMSKMTFGLN